MTRHVVIGALMTIWTTAVFAETRPQTAEDVIEVFHEALLSAMMADSFNERLNIVSPVITNSFSIQTISRISLGRNWRSLSADQQQSYRALMNELVSTTYAARFNNYDDHRFSINVTEPIAKNRTRVRSELRTKTETVNLDYQLQATEDGWRIYDIVANGVSDLSLKRSSYAALFADGGLAAVESDIKASITGNRNNQAD